MASDHGVQSEQIWPGNDPWRQRSHPLESSGKCELVGLQKSAISIESSPTYGSGVGVRHAGGTSTVFWTGNEKKSLQGAVNNLDKYFMEHRGNLDLGLYKGEEWLDDGYVVHAPVGSYYPNPYGLHDVCGNVMEWCQDSFNRSYEITPRDGSAFETGDHSERVYRGGAWDGKVEGCRSAFRYWYDQRNRYYDQGLRPAFSLPPASR